MTEPSSLEGRLAALESAVRSLMATNWTDRASVVDAAGNAVPLSSLAFGQVAAVWAGVGVVAMDGVAGQTSSAVTTPSPGATSTTVQPGVWYQPNPGCQVDVLVQGGRLRVDWASLLALGTTTSGEAPYACMSYSLDYLGDVRTHGATPRSRTVVPDYYRSIAIRDNGAVGNSEQMGSWFMHTGLTPGWYRVQAAFFLGYLGASSGNGSPHMNADNPRIAATPF